ESLFLGSLAAGGTLGILIPPSINLIIYGLITDTSVPELYLAGIFPGLILALLFMAVIIVACLMRPAWGGTKVQTSWRERIRTLPDLLPPILLFVVVVGSIYAGLATPTEAASVGVIFACGLAAWTRTLNLTMLKEAFEGTMRTTAMIMLIIFAAVFLNFILGFMGVTQEILQAISSLGLTPLETMLIIIVFYLILGMFMETLSMMLTTVPIVFPIVASLGYDPVWFGIMITVLMETALITPPIGVNLYVVHGIRSGGGRFNDVAYGAAPFVVAMIAMIALLLMAPGLALWLPGLVY
ncbi:MAG: TRAP transporter large permease, partial [Alphaproteobacteria bacterium]